MQAATLFQSQASLVGGRLAQSVNYGPSPTLTTSLASARKVKALAKREQRPPPLPQLPDTDSAGKYKLFLVAGVYPCPAKSKSNTRKLVLVRNESYAENETEPPYYLQLDDMQDGFGTFYSMQSMHGAIQHTSEDLRRQYVTRHESAYGPFPSL
jgi:hypothetical protein